MVPHKLLLSMFGLIILVSCAPGPTPTPRVVVVTQEVVVTHQVETPTPAVLVVTPTSPPTETPASPTAAPQARSHDWTDYGGICFRPDNLPPGTAVNPDEAAIESARLQILQSLWRVIELSGSAAELTPGFSTSERFVQGVLSDVALRGPFVPVGKTPPRSDPWSFYLGDAAELWREAHPGEKFNGIALDVICFEFFDPFEFEDQKKLPGNPDYIHMVGGVTHAIFAMEQVFEAPRLVVKLYKDPYGKKKGYPDLLGFTPENTPEQNALAANQHLGALVASLNYVMWGNFDGDGVFEFGYGPKNSAPLPVEDFQTLEIFVEE